MPRKGKKNSYAKIREDHTKIHEDEAADKYFISYYLSVDLRVIFADLRVTILPAATG